MKLRATLTGRILFAVLLSNIVLWFGLLLKDAIYFQQDAAFEPMPRFMERGAYRLNQLGTEREAAVFGAAWQKWLGEWLGFPSRVEVWTADGRRIYADPDQPASSPLHGRHEKPMQIQIDDDAFKLFRFDGPRWSLRVAILILSPWEVATKYQHFKNASVRALIALLMLTLPLWLVVRHGLLPLRWLGERLAQRGTEDFGPLRFHAPWRELQPILTVLEKLLRQLRSKVEHEHHFLQDAAHELRTPIAVIAAQAHLLAKATTPGEQNEARQRIEHAMARADHLLAQLAGLEHLSGLSADGLEWFDVVQQAKLTLATLHSQASAHQVAMQLDAPAVMQHYLQRDALQLIFDNLLSNAIRYGARTVLVSLKQSATHVLLAVADDGPGIPAQERERVFERFYRGRGQQTAGSGLGLAIVRQAAQQLQATLELADGLHGRGCCFSLAIPLGRSHAAAMSTSAANSGTRS